MAQSDFRSIIEHARNGGYAVGAFNMHNEETTEALVWAAEKADAPVILQVGRAIIPHMGVARAFEMTHRIAERSNARHVIHLDHGSWDEVIEAIRLGFNSIMYDGAHLPFEENIATTRRVVDIAHAFGIPVEAELVFTFENEFCRALTDALIRRIMVGLNATCGRDVLDRAADILAARAGWDAARKAAEVAAYLRYIERFAVPDANDDRTGAAPDTATTATTKTATGVSIAARNAGEKPHVTV